jgi:hypothetical protein
MVLSAGAAIGIVALTSVISTAGDAGTGFDPLSLVGSVLMPATVIILIMTGKLRTDNEVRSKDSQIHNLSQQLTLERERTQALQTGLMEQAVPALTRQTLILERVTPLLERVTVELEHSSRQRRE